DGGLYLSRISARPSRAHLLVCRRNIQLRATRGIVAAGPSSSSFTIVSMGWRWAAGTPPAGFGEGKAARVGGLFLFVGSDERAAARRVPIGGLAG
ncbi:MAG: hypothetical protein LAQ30_28690, partial [Acidobacteriia bacterium]|nr:hypothetical protein [Terriglobia bacterium]